MIMKLSSLDFEMHSELIKETDTKTSQTHKADVTGNVYSCVMVKSVGVCMTSDHSKQMKTNPVTNLKKKFHLYQGLLKSLALN